MEGRRRCLLFERRGAARTGYGFGGFPATWSTKLSTEVVHQWRGISSSCGTRLAGQILKQIKFYYFFSDSSTPVFLLRIGVIPAPEWQLIPNACFLCIVVQPLSSKGLRGCPFGAAQSYPQNLWSTRPGRSKARAGSRGVLGRPSLAQCRRARWCGPFAPGPSPCS